MLLPFLNTGIFKIPRQNNKQLNHHDFKKWLGILKIPVLRKAVTMYKLGKMQNFNNLSFQNFLAWVYKIVNSKWQSIFFLPVEVGKKRPFEDFWFVVARKVT